MRRQEDRADRMLGLVEAGVVAAAVAGGGQAVPVAAPACHIEGPRRARGEVDARGRVTLRPLLVRCTARGRVVVRIRRAHRRLGRLRGVRFSLPARSASRIRLGGHVSRAGVLGRRRIVVRVRARTESRRLEVTLRRPSAGKALVGVGDQSAGNVRGPAVHPASGADRPAGRPLGRDARRRGRGVAGRGAAFRGATAGGVRRGARRSLPRGTRAGCRACARIRPASGRSAGTSPGCA